MNRQAFFGQSGILGNQLSQRGRLMSLIAVLALVGLSVVGLRASLQSTQSQLNDASASAALTFNVYIKNLEGDLKATSDAIAISPNPDQIFPRTLNRQSSIFELVLVDPQGKVLIQRRRVPGGEGEKLLTEQPWLASVRTGKTYIGPVDYQRYDAGVPFVDIAVPVSDAAGNFYATLIARTDLTAVWNPVISLRIGEKGYVYITDETGQLLAYRTVKLVKSGLNIKDVTGRLPKTIAESSPNFYSGVGGQIVIASGKSLGIAPWYVIVEQPVSEALFFFTILSIVLFILLLMVGFLANSVIRFIQTRVVAPLRLLRTGAEELQQGQFQNRIVIQTEDELGELAGAFNEMAAQLETSFNTLEQRVTERTLELDTANQKNTRRAAKLRTIAEIGNTITSLENLDELLPRITQRVSAALGVYHTGIFLIDSNGEYALLSATNSPGGQKMLQREHRLKVGQVGIVGYVTGTGKARLALDVGEDAEFFNNPDLPETHSEVALPLRIGNKIIGALDVQSEQVAAFDEEDVELLSIVANQVGIAIQNSRQFQNAQDNLKEAQTLYKQFLRQEWKSVVDEGKHLGYRYSNASALPLKAPVTSPEILEAARSGRITTAQETSQSRLAIPILLRGQTIGVLNLDVNEDRPWEQDEIDIAQSVAERVALSIENARLLESSQDQADRERTIGEITSKIGASVNLRNVLQTAVEELGRILPGSDVVIQLESKKEKML